METDNGGNAARLETLVQRAPQRDFKLFEFVIDGDAQRLKNLRCRMTAPERAPAWIGRAPADRCRQIETGSNRMCGPPVDDVAGDPATVSFLTEALQQFTDFAFVEPGDKLSRTFSLRRVEPQVEWSI